jgi:hypothetical protein
MITARILKLGQQSKEFCLEDGSTVGSLLRAAQEPYKEKSVTRGGNIVSQDAPIYDGDTIVIGAPTRGNLDPFVVKFVRLGSSNIDLPAQDGYSIKQILDQLSDEEKARFYHPDGKDAYEYRVGDGRAMTSEATLQRPAQGTLTVVCSQKTKGNE